MMRFVLMVTLISRFSSFHNYMRCDYCQLTLSQILMTTENDAHTFISYPYNIQIENYETTRRLERAKNLMHIEVRELKNPTGNVFSIFQKIPFINSENKIIAKTGFRELSSISTSSLDDVLYKEFNEVGNGLPIAIFVYMWVDPNYRKLGFGDFLLQQVVKECINRGDKYMMIVHDDQGSVKVRNLDFYNWIYSYVDEHCN
eukprot:gene6036-12168_t